jgi:hypothetical protein
MWCAVTLLAGGPGVNTVEDLHQFSDWLSNTPFSQLIQVTSWAIPGIQTVHIVCLALLFSAALVLSLRVLGRGLTAEPLDRLVPRFARAIWTLLVVLLISGSLLIVAEPGRTITNPMFYAKMVMLAVVVAITLWLSAAARRPLEALTAAHRVAAAAAMLLWIGIIFAGRFIAYVESY